jgi:ATP-dependent RNA helicase DeaD
LVEKLEARGFAAAALNGDIVQAQRERTVAALKGGTIDIVVATDVAARGLDVERITHVVNFDVPYDSESYIHRIGRTGRAGRSGEAILFIAPREQNMLRIIERATRQPIEPMVLPSAQDINLRRVAKFKTEIAAAIGSPEAQTYRAVIEEFVRESGNDMLEVAASLASLARGRSALTLPKREAPEGGAEGGEALYRVEVGRRHGLQPGNLVGALAHEGDLHGSQINGIDIRDDHTLVRLPANIPAPVLAHLRGVKVLGQRLDLGRLPARRKKP